MFFTPIFLFSDCHLLYGFIQANCIKHWAVQCKRVSCRASRMRTLSRMTQLRSPTLWIVALFCIYSQVCQLLWMCLPAYHGSRPLPFHKWAGFWSHVHSWWYLQSSWYLCICFFKFPLSKMWFLDVFFNNKILITTLTADLSSGKSLNDSGKYFFHQ